MSQETSQWLNQNVLIGCTDQRGHAWHYRAAAQGDEPNHYPGFIPVDDVQRRLFSWKIVERPSAYLVPASDGDTDVIIHNGERYRVVVDDGHKAILPDYAGPDKPIVPFGVFSPTYQPHQYDEWLIRNVANLLDDDLGISSAGLLRRGGVAWVEVSVPQTVQTSEGVDFRPNLVAATSADGTLVTTFKRTITATVCDNTLSAALRHDNLQQVKVKHSRYSSLKLDSARSALEIIFASEQAFSQEVAELCAIPVTEVQWSEILESFVPVPAEEGRGRTQALHRQEKIDHLYHFDARCKPWKDSVFGVLQTFNTYRHHEQTTRGTERVERNLLNALSGETDKQDANVLQIVRNVLKVPVLA